ncbi:MAG: hypothetical protein LBJ25_01680 [Candidatus Margulisbacteria bacterium]|jgi:hypothetical protein|nr:hypothetical protein [Candidatus Margulisiibacteriota bacterium]
MFEQEFKKFLGTEFKEYKGRDAVNKLLREKQGYVSDSFHREDIGEIALIWGDENAGLAHIVKRRSQEKIDTKEFLSDIPDVIENGVIAKGRSGRFEILYKNKMAVIAPEIYGNKLKFLLTAFKTRKNES